MYPMDNEAYQMRYLAFRRLCEKIKEDPTMRRARLLLDELIQEAASDSKFTLHVYQASIGLSQREEDVSRMEDLFSYYTQCGYYIETRVLLNTDLKVLQEGVFVAWDRAMPSYRMMIPS